MNSYAERFVRSIKEECLDQIIPLGERHLRLAIDEYVEHFHLERNHHGMGNRLLSGTGPMAEGPLRCRTRLGGMIRFYHRTAA